MSCALIAKTEQTHYDIPESDNCPICYEAFGEKAISVTCLPYGQFKGHHLYHSKCIQEWQEKNNICPVCRAPIPANVKVLTLESRIHKEHEKEHETVRRITVEKTTYTTLGKVVYSVSYFFQWMCYGILTGLSRIAGLIKKYAMAMFAMTGLLLVLGIPASASTVFIVSSILIAAVTVPLVGHFTTKLADIVERGLLRSPPDNTPCNIWRTGH